MVTKRGSIENGDIDDFLKKNIKGSYTILSHNMQNKEGIYEVVVQLEDGSIQKIQVEVEQEETHQIQGALLEKNCFNHGVMSFITLLYSSYFLICIFEKRFLQEVFVKRFGVITMIFIGSLTLLQLLGNTSYDCLIDKKVYEFSCMLAGICSIVPTIMKYMFKRKN